ncbi:MAG: hypothetical protein ACRD18_12365, partial [Terriglobia bacterium]
MKHIRLGTFLGMVGVLAMGGCAVQRYKPAPLATAMTAASLEARTLNDPGLKQFIVQSMGRPIAWPPKTWDLRLLTLAAFYFNP